MGVMMYKQDENPICIDHTKMADYESMGWSIHENLESAEKVVESDEKNDDAELLAIAIADYETKFGEKPHHRMKLETILEKLNANEPLQS